MRAAKTTYRAGQAAKRIAARPPDDSEPRIVAVRDSPIHGQGLFARIDLPARRKLGQLSGCLVKLPLARKIVECQPAIYLVELSRRQALDCREGNAFKHLNHSCEPNCYLRIIRRVVEVYTLKQIGRAHV